MRARLHHVELRRAVEAAERHCRGERDALRRALDRLHARGGRHAAGWLLGSGLAAGVIAARLPLLVLLRAARFVADAALFVRRLPIGPSDARRPTPSPERGA